MYKFSSASKTMATAVCALMLALPVTLLAACSGTELKPFSQYSEYAVKAADDGDPGDAKWAAYLKSHFQKRATDRDCIIAGKAQDDSQLQLVVDLDGSMDSDYEVAVAPHEIRLKARSTEAMLWLQYQFMSSASADDGRFLSADLPPAVVDCRSDAKGSFAFEHRSIYTPTNTNADMMPILGVGNVDFDWGLWGHNLRKVFTDGIPAEATAMVNGKRDAGQFCFSSEALYRAYEQFVIDQYGDGSDGVTTRFAVVPNDNRLVCQCAACKAKGNTPQSATPAVTALIERLARRFPHQMFFTSAYSTTRKAPTHRLPDNVGVMVSAIDMPMAPEASQAKGHEGLEAQVKAWQQCCGRVYVWDYMRNFDDYLTPYPCLHHMQSRLRFYRDLGVKGVFLNGSGYDYAPFDDVQTYVLAQLLINPDVDIEACASRYFASAYPKTGQLLGDYYRKIEQQAQRATLPFYGGIDEALGTWLDAQQFGEFFSTMDKASKQADEAERSKLNRMLTALAFTRLEIMRSQQQAPSRQQIEAMTSLLAHHTAFEDMANYRESDGDLDAYLKQWHESYPWLGSAGNLLHGASIDAEPKTDAHLLSDGKQGFATDYHLGWLITSAPVQRFSVSSGLPSAAVFHVSLLHAPQWHIFAPSSIEVVQGGAVKGKAIITAPTDSRRVRVSISATGLQPGVKTEVIITQTATAEGRKTMALDEIEITNRQ